MNAQTPWPRRLLWLGLFCMFVGAVDPLEGSLVILAGAEPGQPVVRTRRQSGEEQVTVQIFQTPGTS